MKSVLFIAPQPFFAWRGSPIRVKYNVTALAELGFRVDLLTLPLGQPQRIPGVRIIRVPNPLGVRAIPIGPSPLKILFDLLLLAHALRLARSDRYDIIHGVEEAGFIAWIVAAHCGARLVYEKHSDPASYGGGYLRNLLMACYARSEAFIARRADITIVTGAGLAAQIGRHAPHGAVHSIPDVASSRARPVSERVAALEKILFASKREGVVVTYVGSFAPYQGVELVFEAIPAVTRRAPNLHFQIIGGSTGEIAFWRARLAHLGVPPERVHFMGLIDPERLPEHLAASQILLSPRREGVNSPLKLLDYLRAGRAIVATDVAANRVLLDERVAVLVEPSAGALADGILALAGNDRLRHALGERARRRYRARYGYARFKERLEKGYRALGVLGALLAEGWCYAPPPY